MVPSLPQRFSLLYRRALKDLILWTVCIGLLGCGQASEPGSSPAPRPSVAGPPGYGLGQRQGHDVGSQPGRGSTPLDEGQQRIVAFGDSLTAGLGVSPEESYPAELQRRLSAAGYRYVVINAGVSGETTAGALRRVEWVLNSRPSIVILETGGNDGLRGLDIAETRANLEQIIRRLQVARVTVVLTGIKLPPNYGADYIGRFAAIYPELAREYRVTLMPFFLEGVATRSDLNQADGIHPTADGYRVIVDHLMPVLEPLMEKAHSPVS